MVFVAILAPLAAALMKAAISRRRESLADATAVAFTRYPTGLRRALEKLDADSSVVQKTSHATSHLWIESPDDREQGNKGAKFNEMFNTHPPLRERINILRRMEGLDPYTGPDDSIVRDLAERTQHTPPPTLPAPAVRSGAAATNPAAASMPNLPQIFSAAPGATVAAALPEPALAASAHHDPQVAPPAGWYADPSGKPRTQRYWNGTHWTDHTARR
jgi:hypothetical protein